jgi:hypothetical protein
MLAPASAVSTMSVSHPLIRGLFAAFRWPSSPPRATLPPRARSSVGERSPHTREVTGSKPVGPTQTPMFEPWLMPRVGASRWYCLRPALTRAATTGLSSASGPVNVNPDLDKASWFRSRRCWSSLAWRGSAREHLSRFTDQRDLPADLKRSDSFAAWPTIVVTTLVIYRPVGV